MQDKQKVTLYLPPGLHRQLKIRAAVDLDSMSATVERALMFYLEHPELVDEAEAASHGRTHRVYNCPECQSALVQREGEMVTLKNQPSVVTEEVPVEQVQETLKSKSKTDLQGEETLVPC